MRLQTTRYIPPNAQEIAHSGGLAIVYQYQGPRGLCALAYSGKRSKADWHFRFKDSEQVQHKASEYFAGLESWHKMKADYKASRTAPHSLIVGDIIHHSWGWEQTQCDYYQILAVTAHGATIRAIRSETVEGSTYSHGMADMQMPVRDGFFGPEVRVRIDGTNRVTTLKHGCASKWDGRANYCSWYG